MKSNFYELVLLYIIKWIVLSLVLGFLGANLVFFLKLVIELLRNLMAHTWFLTPIVGGALVGCIAYFDNRSSGLGTNYYIEYTKKGKTIDQAGRLLVGKFANTSFTLGLMGVEGLVGPILLLGSSLASFLQQIAELLQVNVLEEDEYRVLNVCGAAAALGPFLGTPIGSGIFASEVLYESSLDYNDLFPAVLSGSFGYFFYKLLYDIPGLDYNIKLPGLNPRDILFVVIVALIAGFLGQGIIFIYDLLNNWIDELEISVFLKPVIAGLIVAVLIKIFNISDIVTKLKIEEIIFSGLSLKLALSLLIYKILVTIIVVSSGGSVAIVDTAVVTGGLLGNLLYFLIPLPLNVLVVTGMSAILASLANVPLATIIVIAEMFGVNLSLSIALGSITGFLIGRSHVVYQYLEIE